MQHVEERKKRRFILLSAKFITEIRMEQRKSESTEKSEHSSVWKVKNTSKRGL